VRTQEVAARGRLEIGEYNSRKIWGRGIIAFSAA
jgi:hypothetical protein